MIAKTLEKLRENNGYTQRQVADALNIERSTYTYYETGKTTPDINTIIKLAKIFNVPYTDIFEAQERHQHKLHDASGDFNTQEIKMLHYSYELTKDEQQMLINYRVLSQEDKEKFADLLAKNVRNQNKKL